MNEKINLCEILKDCPVGVEFWSPLADVVKFGGIYNNQINVTLSDNTEWYIEPNGKMKIVELTAKSFISAEIMLYPSKDQRDWSKFSAPWYQNGKIKKFDPRTLRPFDKILVRDSRIENWYAAQFSHIAFDLSEYDLDDCEEALDFIICTTGSTDFNYCIPFNDDTKHLVGTSEDALEVYKYWED